MKINTDQIVSISEANQNFSKIARMVDKSGIVYIFKNNKPKYKLVEITEKDLSAPDAEEEKRLTRLIDRVLKKYRKMIGKDSDE